MTASTPLDTLKAFALRIEDLISNVLDDLAGREVNSFDDDDSAMIILDSAKALVSHALAEQIPGIAWDGICRTTTPEARASLEAYDDGSRVVEWFQTSGGRVITAYFPRYDGDKTEFLDRFVNAAVVLDAEAIAFEAAHPPESI